MPKSNLKKENLLIAGSRGLIGSACLKIAKKKSKYNLFLPSSKELNYLNLNDFMNYCLTKNIDYIIFAVGKVGGIFDNQNNQIDYMLYNIELTNNLLKVALKCNFKKIVTFSSSCMYSLKANQPYEEKNLSFINVEKTSFGYALSKFYLTKISELLNINNSYKCRFINVIPNSTFGPHDNFDLKTGHVLACLINRLYEAKLNNYKEITLFGSGKPKREFIFSEDVAEAVFHLLEKKGLDLTLPINIGTGYEISISELADKIANIVDYKGKINFNKEYEDGAGRKLLNSSIINNLGWKSSTNFDEGLKETYNWFKKNLKK